MLQQSDSPNPNNFTPLVSSPPTPPFFDEDFFFTTTTSVASGSTSSDSKPPSSTLSLPPQISIIWLSNGALTLSWVADLKCQLFSRWLDNIPGHLVLHSLQEEREQQLARPLGMCRCRRIH
ncbi:serine/threonine-protein phosphatase 7-like [Abeliophyllum distichum]|uniref:Serine/threonine-protein phosphatase 7-like n=1 Tax=Abeliophyllum distichum TaxID=126358 RepID=A0ABD1PI29_9LAMI